MIPVSAILLQIDLSNVCGWICGVCYKGQVSSLGKSGEQLIFWFITNWGTFYVLRQIEMLIMLLSSCPKQAPEKKMQQYESKATAAEKLIKNFLVQKARNTRLWRITETISGKSTMEKKCFSHFRMTVACQCDCSIKNCVHQLVYFWQRWRREQIWGGYNEQRN